MTIKHMRIFLEVYRTQNMTKAAKILNMTQPAVTRAVKEVEIYYGLCLFERINRRLFITESGTRFYSHALHIMEAFDMMETELKSRDLSGTIHVGASITIGNYLLPQLTKEFQVKYPSRNVKVLVANGDRIQKKLLDNELDLAFIEGRTDHPDFVTKQVGSDRLVLITPPGHPVMQMEQVELEDLMSWPFLLREEGSTVRALIDSYFAVRGLTLHPLWESASTQAIVRAVSCGLGISFLPEQLAAADIRSGKVMTREIADTNLSREYHLIWHKNKHLTESLQNFIALCEAKET